MSDDALLLSLGIGFTIGFGIGALTIIGLVAKGITFFLGDDDD